MDRLSPQQRHANMSTLLQDPEVEPGVLGAEDCPEHAARPASEAAAEGKGLERHSDLGVPAEARMQAGYPSEPPPHSEPD